MDPTPAESPAFPAGRDLLLLGLWIAGGGLPWLACYAALAGSHSTLALPLMMIGGWMVAPLPFQMWALRPFGVSGRRWLVGTLLAVALTSALTIKGSLLPPVAVAIAQWLALRRRVENAYLWPALAIVTSTARLLGILEAAKAEPISVFVFVLAAVMEAALLLFLLHHPRQALGTRGAAAQMAPARPATAPVERHAAPPQPPAPATARLTATPEPVVLPPGSAAPTRPPRALPPQRLTALPLTTRASLYLFLAAIVVLTAVRLSPGRQAQGVAGADYVLELAAACVACGVLALLSLFVGIISFTSSRRALWWMVPTALLLLLPLTPVFFGPFIEFFS